MHVAFNSISGAAYLGNVYSDIGHKTPFIGIKVGHMDRLYQVKVHSTSTVRTLSLGNLDKKVSVHGNITGRKLLLVGPVTPLPYLVNGINNGLVLRGNGKRIREGTGPQFRR